jgi:uncharacterized protein (DUF1800 family)
MLTTLIQSRWNAETAAHLLNRAGFGADPETIAGAAARSPAEVVDELLDFSAAADFGPPSWLNEPEVNLRPNRRAMRDLPEEERQQLQREMRQREGERMAELRAWWLYRMRYSTRPLQEKLTLFWHGHFATSMEKVKLRLLHVPAERNLPRPRGGPLAHPGGGGGARSRHADLLGQRPEPGWPAQREFRPRADGAVYPG